jgi:hypothetical protein
MQRSSCVRFLHGQECKSRCFPTICHTKAARGTIAGSPFEHRRPFTRSVEFPNVALLAQPCGKRTWLIDGPQPRDPLRRGGMLTRSQSVDSDDFGETIARFAAPAERSLLEWWGAAELQMRRSALMTPELNAWPESTVADVQPRHKLNLAGLVPGELPCGAAGRHACRDFRARAVSRSC